MSFPSFLMTPTGFSTQASFSRASHLLKDFSFELTPLEEKIFNKAKTFYLKKQKKKAFNELKKMTEEKIHRLIYKRGSFFRKFIFKSSPQFSEEEKKALKKKYVKITTLRNFILGFFAFEIRQWNKAEYHFEKSLRQNPEGNRNFNPFIHYYLGKIYMEKAFFNDAREEFNKVFSYKSSNQLVYKSQFELSQVSIKNKEWEKAYKKLKFLERKWKFREKYPEILWNLIKVAQMKKSPQKACYWARKIYSHYPTHPFIHDWTSNLKVALFNKKPLNCTATYKDQKRRIQTLQRSGELKKAEEEIKQMRENLLKVKEEKLKIAFEKIRPIKKQKTLSLTRSMRKKNRMKKERIKKEIENEYYESLYEIDKIHALFLIYDGYSSESVDILLKHSEKRKEDFEYLGLLGKASRESGEYLIAVQHYYLAYKKNQRSPEGKKALFYSAFLSYRFRDYDRAYKKFKEFTNKYKKSQFFPYAYWYLSWTTYLRKDYKNSIKILKKALKMKKRNKNLWAKISEEKLQYWLAVGYLQNNEEEKAKKIFLELMSDQLLGYYAIAAFYRFNTLSHIESIANLFDYHELKRKLSENSKRLSSTSKASTSKTLTSKTLISEVLNKELHRHLEVARNFIVMGIYYWARWGLYHVESQTKNPHYLKVLMKGYDQIQSFHRSSYISTVYFVKNRKNQGLLGEFSLWEKAFPKAYFEIVEDASNTSRISEELIWAVMRAESKYRHDIVSPVGAKGLMQIMPHTANKVTTQLLNKAHSYNKNLMEPKTNIEIGAHYLNRLLKKFEGQVPLAVASYNAGPHRVRNWLNSFGTLDMDEFIEHIPFVETRQYVKKVVRNFKIYQYLYNKKTLSMKWLIQPIAMVTKKEMKGQLRRESWEPIH